MFCENCGNKLLEGAKFCGGCGARMEAPVDQASPEEDTWLRQTTPQQPPCTPLQQTAAPRQAYALYAHGASNAPPQAKHSKLRLIFAIVAAALGGLCVGACFLFLSGKLLPAQTAGKPARTATVAAEPAPVQTTEPPPPDVAPETVSDQTIRISMAFDSGEGTYTGEMKDGVPHGQGSFTMQSSDNNLAWSYEGQWENGEIAGQGVKKQDSYIFTGTFRGGLLNGNGEITDNGVLRYKGMWADGSLHGAGTLYTKSGTLIFEGTFENDMLVESEADRKRRGEAFKPQCEDMDGQLYDACMAEDNTFGYPVAVWGFPLGMAEQAASGTIVIGHFADGGYPVCLLYRYAVGEPKMTGDDWINAWGVVTGLFEYTDENGTKAICPQVEVICWNNEQEGL